jgi:hypothetical protein
MSRKRRNNKLAIVTENPPERRGDRRTAKLLSLLDSLKPSPGNQHKESAKR